MNHILPLSGSTVSSEPYVQTLDDHRLFPYRLLSLPTNEIYHNLTQVNLSSSKSTRLFLIYSQGVYLAYQCI